MAVLAPTFLSAADAPQGCLANGAYYILHGQYGRAIEQLQGLSTAGTSSASALNLRGLAQMLGGNPKAALAFFDQGLALEPRPELRFNHALAELKLGDPTKAAAEFQAIYEDNQSPFRARAAYHGALALETLGRVDEAEAWVERSLKLDPHDQDALAYIGLLRERRGDLQAAGRAYQELLRRNPELPFALLRFGVAAMRAGRTDTARGYFQKVIAAAPSSPEAVEARKYLVLWD